MQECKYEVGRRYRKVSGRSTFVANGEEVTFGRFDPDDPEVPFKVWKDSGEYFWLFADVVLEPVDDTPAQPQPPAPAPTPAPSAVPLRDQVYGKAEHEAYMARQHDNEQLKTACHQWKEGQMTQAIRRFLCGPGIEHSDTHGIED